MSAPLNPVKDPRGSAHSRISSKNSTKKRSLLRRPETAASLPAVRPPPNMGIVPTSVPRLSQTNMSSSRVPMMLTSRSEGAPLNPLPPISTSRSVPIEESSSVPVGDITNKKGIANKKERLRIKIDRLRGKIKRIHAKMFTIHQKTPSLEIKINELRDQIKKEVNRRDTLSGSINNVSDAIKKRIIERLDEKDKKIIFPNMRDYEKYTRELYEAKNELDYLNKKKYRTLKRLSRNVDKYDPTAPRRRTLSYDKYVETGEYVPVPPGSSGGRKTRKIRRYF
jgi:uncharacterized protein YoxC